jgi:hypothetical protein
MIEYSPDMAVGNNAHARAVGIAGTALVGSSLLGGAVSVMAGTSTWANAWTADATLAAPWPMLVVQTAATVAAISRRRWLATAGSVVLGLTAAVAGISGFFDGQLGRDDLSTWHVVGQFAYVVVAWGTAVVAGLRLWKLRSPRSEVALEA